MVSFARRAKALIEELRRHFNEVRPHSSLGYLTPNEFVAQGASPAPRRATSAGTNAASKGSRLKLAVVRRIWAGHSRHVLIHFGLFLFVRA
jgi:hypothetical protein